MWNLVLGQHPVPELQVRHPSASQVALLHSVGQLGQDPELKYVPAEHITQPVGPAALQCSQEGSQETHMEPL